jgi:MFS family permease
MQSSGVGEAGLSFPRGISRYQWLVFFVVWAGWSLDAADFGLYSLVLQPALRDLLGGSPTPADIGRVGGIISTVGLLGWALGGFTFGIIADYIGRVRTLALSILIFSAFTALQGLAQTPFQLGIFRFFAGVGTGAEIIVGIPLVAEAFAESNRARILGIMMTGGAVGTLVAAQVYNLIGAYGWRWVFFVGIAPALLLVFIRRGMVEPERFEAVRQRRRTLAGAHEHSEDDKEFMRFVPVQLFNRQNRYSTIVGLLFCVGTLLAIWTSNIWLPTIQRGILAGEGIQGNAAISYISFGMTMWSLGGIFGYAAFGFIADAIGRRPTIFIYNLGTLLVGLYLYLAVSTFAPYPWLLFFFGFFVFGVFSGHAVYLPELFPTHVRATAVSFCNGSGRIITSFGPLLAGLLVGVVNLNHATAGMTCFALLSILAMYLGRETKNDPLPLFEVGSAAKEPSR